MQTQRYELEGLAQSNAILASSNSALIAQLKQMTVTMNAMQTKLKTLTSSQTKQTRLKINHYCWICRSKYTHGRKPDNKIKRDTKMTPTTRRILSDH